MTTVLTLKQLFYLDLRRFINVLKFARTRDYIKMVVLTAITLIFIAGELGVVYVLFQHIMNQIHLGELRYVLLAKLLQMVFLVFTTILIYSNIVMTISSFFLSPEIDLYLSKPVNKKTLFLYRFTETFLRSSWMFVGFGIPILLAYGMVMGRGLLFIPQIILVILPSLLLPTSIGVVIGILLIRIFSPRLAQRVFFLLGVFLSVGLVLIFRWMRPEQLIDPIGVEQLTFYLKTLRMPSINWLPTAWAAESIAAYGEGNTWENIKYASYLWIVSLMLLRVSFLTYELVWFKAKSGGRGTDIVDSSKTDDLSRRKKAGRFRMSILFRDLLIFNRDAGQWSQVIVIAALIFIYIFNFKNLPYELFGFQYSMSFISVLASH